MSKKPNAVIREAIIGCIFGTAVGDSMGLKYEGIPRGRLARMRPDFTRQSLFFGRGMVSDDTEHTCMVAQALAASVGDVDRFSRVLAGLLRRWLLCVPPGTGLATARAATKLLLGVGPANSGVFSAGNGPAMRSALIGVCFGENRELLKATVGACTRITHTDPKAEYGALAVALAAFWSARQMAVGDFGDAYLQDLRDLLDGRDGADELITLIGQAASSAAAAEPTTVFADKMGWKRGISGYIYATVPACLHAWFRHAGAYEPAIRGLIECGGDTDTTAAIAGGIIGAGIGPDQIPRQWVDSILEWPCGPKWMLNVASRLYDALQSGDFAKPRLPAYPLMLARNIFFLIIVLAHGFRRLLPPY